MHTRRSVLAGLVTPVGQRSVRRDKEAPRAEREGGLWTGRHPLARGPHPQWSETPNLLVEGALQSCGHRETSSGVRPVFSRLGQTSLRAEP